MNLFHFTSGDRLRAIARYGLTVGSVPTKSILEKGKVGVWLTTSPQPEGQGFDDWISDKRFRITVDIPDGAPQLHCWQVWAGAHASAEVISDLQEATSSVVPSRMSDWHVYFGQVPPDQILHVTDALSGEDVGNWSTLWPESESHPGVPFWRRDAWHKKVQKAVDRAVLKRGADLGLI